MRITVKVTLPQHSLDPAKFEAAIQRAQERIAADAVSDFHAVTSTWNTPVTFSLLREHHSISVATSDKRFIWTDRGTNPHLIKPKLATGALRFRVGGAPKTRVRELSSTMGAVGPDWRSAKEVHHPGTDARWFSEEVADKRAPIYRDYMQAEINEAAQG